MRHLDDAEWRGRVLRELGDANRGIGEMRAQLQSHGDSLRAHDQLDTERFSLIRSDIRELRGVDDTLKTRALDAAEAKVRTAEASKFEWVKMVASLVLGAALSALIGWALRA